MISESLDRCVFFPTNDGQEERHIQWSRHSSQKNILLLSKGVPVLIVRSAHPSLFRRGVTDTRHLGGGHEFDSETSATPRQRYFSQRLPPALVGKHDQQRKTPSNTKKIWAAVELGRRPDRTFMRTCSVRPYPGSVPTCMRIPDACTPRPFPPPPPSWSP